MRWHLTVFALALAVIGCGGDDSPDLTRETFITYEGKILYHGERGECRLLFGKVDCIFTDKQGQPVEMCRVPKAEAKPIVRARDCPPEVALPR